MATKTERTLSAKKLINLLNTTQTEYEKCWGILSDLKQAKINKDFINFQEILASSIYQLENARISFLKRRKYYENAIENIHLNKKYCIKQIKKLSKLIDHLNKIESIGRSMGDAFALLFYRSNPEMLFQHHKHPQSNSAQGLGLKGEIEICRRMKSFDGNLLIYHGITNILRIGDFSLFNIKTAKISGYCEIKTQRMAPDKIIINASIVSNSTSLPFNITEEKDSENIPNFAINDKIKAKLDTQVKKMTELLEQKSPSKASEKLLLENKVSVLENFKKSKFNFVNIDKDLVLLRVPYCQKFSKRITFEIDPLKIDDLKRNIVENLVKKNSLRNSLEIGDFFYQSNNIPATLPSFYSLFWEPIDIKTLKDIYFQNYFYITLFNPLFFIEELEKMGFNVKKNRQGISATLKIKNILINFENLNYYIALHNNFLYSLESIMKMIEKQKDIAILNKNKQIGKINFLIFNKNFFKDTNTSEN